MSWTNAQFVRNTDNPNIGELTVVWNKGLADEFTYTDRVDSVAGLVAFKAAANAAQQAFAASQTALGNKVTQLLTFLNS